MQFCQNIKEFSTNYDYFIFDLWGVIHDGVHLYPGVIDALTFLKKEGKNICFLSNAPRRSHKVADLLNKFSITQDFYKFILTSGEATFLDFQKNQEKNFAGFGKKYFYIGPQKDIDLFDGLSYERVDLASQANFVIATGFENESSVLQEKLPQILEAKKYNLPLVCVNPDLIVVRKDGAEMICAGVMAAEYERLGGKVIYYGKPFPSVYDMTYKLFGAPNKNKIVAIGDGIETDIKGAFDFDISSALVTSGILCNKLGVFFDEESCKKKLQDICESYKIFPNYVISKL